MLRQFWNWLFRLATTWYSQVFGECRLLVLSVMNPGGWIRLSVCGWIRYITVVSGCWRHLCRRWVSECVSVMATVQCIGAVSPCQQLITSHLSRYRHVQYCAHDHWWSLRFDRNLSLGILSDSLFLVSFILFSPKKYYSVINKGDE